MIIKAGENTEIRTLGVGPQQASGGKTGPAGDGGEYVFDEQAADFLLRIFPAGIDVLPDQAAPDGEDAPAAAQVKFMITRQDEEGLRSLGYSQARIDRMKPQEAQAILQAGTRAEPETN